jgi:hypothetical protein
MSHICETPVETVVDLIARILSACVNIKKYARYICTRTQRTFCVTSRITMKSQAASMTALVNYWVIFPPKFTTIKVFLKYINKHTLIFVSALHYSENLTPLDAYKPIL